MLKTVWILIAVVDIYKGGAAFTIDNFVSKGNCEIAITQIEAARLVEKSHGDTINMTCIPVVREAAAPAQGGENE